MATHYTITPTANILGTLGAVCWSVQLLPQIILNHRNKSTAGLEPAFMLLWASAGCPLAVYNTVNAFNIALVVQPQLLTVLSLVTWAQCQIYGNGPDGGDVRDSPSPPPSTRARLLRLTLRLAPLALLLASLETLLILLCRLALSHGHLWPTTACGILAGILLCAGVGCEYYGIWKSRSVEGISFLFCGIDAAGDLCSVGSVLTQHPHDYVALGIYLAEFTFWAGIFACGGYYRFFPWLLSKSSVLRRLRHLTSPAHSHSNSQGRDGGGVVEDDLSAHRGDGVEMSAQSDDATRDSETTGVTAGRSGNLVSAVSEGAAAASREAAGREGMEEEPMTLSVFRTASSATTASAGSLRRRPGLAGISLQVDNEVV